MINGGDVYRLVEAMVPLYVALILGYGSVKWWRLFTDDQCNAINRMVCYFIIPLFLFQYVSHIDPTRMNFRFLAADTISKVLVIIVLAAWSMFTRKKYPGIFVNSYCYCWSITVFNVTTMISPLVIGTPLMDAMYGQWAVEYVVQAGLAQYLIWYVILLFAMEGRRIGMEMEENLEENRGGEGVVAAPAKRESSFVRLTKIVLWKFITNPNFYTSIVGIIWAYIASRYHLTMPAIVEGSVLTMSKGATGISMFSIGLFMACQKKLLACGAPITAFVFTLKFIVGPIVTTISAYLVRLSGDALRVTIIQAALPQSIMSFVFAREYQLHPDVLGTMVTFGTVISLPVLIAYYAVVEALR